MPRIFTSDMIIAHYRLVRNWRTHKHKHILYYIWVQVPYGWNIGVVYILRIWFVINDNTGTLNACMLRTCPQLVQFNFYKLLIFPLFEAEKKIYKLLILVWALKDGIVLSSCITTNVLLYTLHIILIFKVLHPVLKYCGPKSTSPPWWWWWWC